LRGTNVKLDRNGLTDAPEKKASRKGAKAQSEIHKQFAEKS